MAKLGRSMSMASRLAAATALTGTLAACDGLGGATDALVNPFDTQTAAEAAVKSPQPAEPGNPVYIGGSRILRPSRHLQTLFIKTGPSRRLRSSIFQVVQALMLVGFQPHH